MLDISIKPVSAKYKTPEQLLSFMKLPSTVEHKTDGVKLTLIKVADTGTLNDWIVSYKGSIFYRGEFDYADMLGKRLTLGNSQFDLVFDHLETLGKTSIEVNTEFFIEFLVHKQTVMSEYSTNGQMILIGYGEASPETRFGKVKTNANTLKTADRERYARELQINLPPVLFKGTWYPAAALKEGAKSKSLRKIIDESFSTLKTLENDPNAYYNLCSALFLRVESQFGGREEGIVVKNEDGLFKIQQDYQLDKNARFAKKKRWMEDDEQAEQNYWDDVIEAARVIASEVTTQDIPTGLKQIAARIKKLPVAGTHSKKNEHTIRDDIQINARNFYLRNLHGNDGALVIGKFRVFTLGHQRMIERAIRESDEVVIGMVTGKQTANTAQLRLSMLRAAYPNLRIIELKTGNLFTAFKKAEININKIYAGSDRVQDYERMLLKAPGVTVKEIERTGTDISATKVIDNLSDKKFFENNTPKSTHRFYNEIAQAYL